MMRRAVLIAGMGLLAALPGWAQTPTSTWTTFYSSNTVVNDNPIRVGTVIEAYDPDGVLAGSYTVDEEGQYGFLHVYGDDPTTTGVDEGAVEGDVITFKIDGVTATGQTQPTWTSGSPGATIEHDLTTELPDPDLGVKEADTGLSLLPGGSLAMTLDEGDGNDLNLLIENTGEEELSWAFDFPQGPPAWLTLGPSSGSVSVGGSEAVTLSLDASALAAGTYSEVLTILSNDLNQPSVSIPLDLEVVFPTPAMTPAGYIFNLFEGESGGNEVTLENLGTSTLNWTLSSNVSWLTPDEASGALAGGGTKRVGFTVSTLGLAPGSYAGSLKLTAPEFEGELLTSVELNVNEPMGEVSLSDTELDLGTPFVEIEQGFAFMTVANIGDAGLTINGVSVVPLAEPTDDRHLAFTLRSGAGGGTIAPSEQFLIEVLFDPTEAGLHEARLLIDVQGDEASPYEIALRGTGLRVPVSEADSLALVALFATTNGLTDWTDKTGWLTDPITEWYGVRTFPIPTEVDGGETQEVTYVRHVTGVDLASNNLTGFLPSGFTPDADFLYLDQLNLSDNSISGTIPADLGGLTSLFFLDLGGNQLTGTIPAELGNLANLNVLTLSDNQLTGAIPAELGNLTALSALFLNNNSLEGAVPATLANLTQLRFLHVDRNDLEDALPDLSVLAKLESFFVSDNRLTGTLPPWVGSLGSLNALGFDGNRFTGGLPAAWLQLDSLRFFNIEDNLLDAALPDDWSAMDSLHTFSAARNTIPGEIPAGLGNAAELRHLNLADNQLMGAIPTSLEQLDSLQNLILSDNSLSGAVPPEFADLQALTLLFLDNNDLTDLPDLSGVVSLTDLYVNGNRLTFEDLEPNLRSGEEFVYQYLPQQPFGEAQTEVFTVGTTQSLGIPLAGNVDAYAWFKGDETSPVATTETLTFDPVLIDAGDEYVLQATNDALGLTLTSAPITVEVQAPTFTAPETVNFGEQRAGTISGAKTVTITNDGTVAPLLLQDLRIPDDEGTPENESEIFALADGLTFPITLGINESVQLDLAFTPPATSDFDNASFASKLLIESNASAAPVEVPLVGQSVEPLLRVLDGTAVLEPGTDGIDFGLVRLGESQDTTLAIRNDGNTDLRLDDLRIVNPDDLTQPERGDGAAAQAVQNVENFSVVAGGIPPGDPVTLAPGAERAVTVRFEPLSRSGDDPFFANLVIDSDDDNRTAHFFDLEGQGVEPEIAFDPASVANPATPFDFGQVRVGEEDDEALVFGLQNIGNGLLTLASAQIVDDATGSFALAPESIVSPGETVAAGGSPRTFTVSFRPQVEGPVMGALEIVSDATSSPDTVYFIGEGIVSNLVLSVTEIDFGAVRVNNSSAQQPVTITNEGSASVNVTGLSVDRLDGVFDINGETSGVLAPNGGSIEALVTFTPDALGAFAATLTISSDEADQTIDLLGVGIDTDPVLTLPAFEATRIRATFDTTFTLKNQGDFPLTVTALSVGETTGDDRGSGAAAFELLALTGEVPLPTPETPVVLARDDSLKIGVRFVPGDVPGAHRAQLEVASNAAAALGPVPLVGFALAPVVTIPPINFTPTLAGTTTVDTLRIANIGNTYLLVSEVSAVLGDSAARYVLDTTPLDALDDTVRAGTQVKLPIAFSPLHPGPHPAEIQLTMDDVQQAYLVVLSAVGVQPALTPSPGEVVFDQTDLGETPIESVVLTNSGTSALNISALRIAAEGTSSFRIQRLIRDGQPLPVSPGQALEDLSLRLPPTETVTVEIRFLPRTVGQKIASLIIESDAPNSPGLVPLQGFGRRPNLPPVASDTSAGFNAGDFTITIPPNPDFVPDVVTLFYRQGGEASFRSLPFVENAGSFTVTIPAADLTIRGLEYFVEVRKGTGVDEVVFEVFGPGDAPFGVQVLVPVAAPPFELAPEGYQMISVPLEFRGGEGNIVEMLTDDLGDYGDAWRMLRWSPTLDRYLELSEFELGAAFQAGRAAWLITREATAFDVARGLSVPSTDSVEIVLARGWNQFSNPFAFPVAWDDVEKPERVGDPVGFSAGALDSTGYVYGVTELQPWRGYFVFSDGPAQLKIPPREAGAGTSAKRRAVAHWADQPYRLQLTARAPAYQLTDTQNYVGFAKEDAEAIRIAEAPMPGRHIRLSVLGEDAVPLVGSFAPIDEEGHAWDFEVEVVLPDERLPTRKAVTVALQETGPLPEGFARYVFDLDRGRVVPVADGVITLEVSPSAPVKRLRLVMGTAAFAEAHSDGIPLVPLDDRLDQNYPNPFNPMTTVGYQLSERKRVVIALYDLLGRRVATLVDEEQPAGAHEVRWDGRSDSGASVASGVYFYRMQAGDFLATRKLTLVR